MRSYMLKVTHKIHAEPGFELPFLVSSLTNIHRDLSSDSHHLHKKGCGGLGGDSVGDRPVAQAQGPEFTFPELI